MNSVSTGSLTNLSDEVLIERTKGLVREERKLLTSILHHLREIERRRLYSKYKYSSLFAYAVSELKYSEPQADRRISAMRLLRDVPQIEEKITSGALSLTNMVLAQKLFSKEKKAGRIMSPQNKVEVLDRLEHQTSRNAEKIVCEISPEMKMRKKEFDFNQITDDSLREKLLQLKGHFAHKHPDMSLNQLMHQLCDEKLSSIEMVPSAPRVKTQAKVGTQTEILRQIRQRDKSQCSNCGSTYALEIDHVIPKAVGGRSTQKNLRLLCRSCNQRAAIEYFGIAKMGRYLEPRQ